MWSGGHEWMKVLLGIFMTHQSHSRLHKPLGGSSQYHIHSTALCRPNHGHYTMTGECITSYDITMLCTLVPVIPALNIVQNKTRSGSTLQTKLTLLHIIKHLGFCHHSTYFLFQGKYYEEVEGTAMGSPISYIIANFEHF